MKFSQQLANRFREVIFDGTWVANTNYKSQLEGLTWQQATTKVNSYNTIAALTFHINYYVAGVLQVFQGGTLDIRDKFSFDTPEITSDEDWNTLKNSLFTNAESFAKHVAQFSEEQLTSDFVKPAYGTYLRNIEGMIEHCYYHLGQVSLIRKSILSNT
jgi:hypothetical protein